MMCGTYVKIEQAIGIVREVHEWIVALGDAKGHWKYISSWVSI
jgi:hypothetical protein